VQNARAPISASLLPVEHRADVRQDEQKIKHGCLVSFG
jgi:hypothetical protein